MSTRSERVVNYVQSIAIIVAGVWALYTFVLQSALSPRHVSLEVSVLAQGTYTIDDVPFKYVNYKFSVENTGQRRIKLIVAGTQIHGHKAKYEDNFSVPASTIDYPIRSNSTFLWHKEIQWSASEELISMAYHFPEYYLNAGENVSEVKTVVFPKSKNYDFLSFSSVAKSLLKCDSFLPWKNQCDRLIAVVSSGASDKCKEEQLSEYDLCFRYQKFENNQYIDIPATTIQDNYTFSSFTNGIIMPISF